MKRTHDRKSTRLYGYDYSKDAAFFVTLITQNRICWLGKVENKKVILSEIGEIVKSEWEQTPIIRKNITLGEWIIMPNHLHAILYIGTPKLPADLRQLGGRDGANYQEPDNPAPFKVPSNNLGAVMMGFKSAAKSKIVKAGYPAFMWHRNYHDSIIRDQIGLKRIERYIQNNPNNWSDDDYYAP